MRLISSIFFLTLVLISASGQCAPQTTTTVAPIPYRIEEDPLLAASEPRELRNYLLNISLGLASGHYLEQDRYQQGPFLTLRYMPLVDDGIQWDYQAEVHLTNNVGLSVGRRWYCCEKDPYNPFLRLSGNLILQGSSELAGAIAVRRWRARAGVGIGQKYIFEFGFGFAVTGADLFAQTGINF